MTAPDRGPPGTALPSGPCPRATPSTWPASGCARRSPVAPWCAASCGTRGWPGRTSPGAPCSTSASVGKHLFTRFDDGRSLHSHFRMDGSWHLYRPDMAWRRPAHEARAVLATADRVAVGFALHDLELLPTAERGPAGRPPRPGPAGPAVGRRARRRGAAPADRPGRPRAGTGAARTAGDRRRRQPVQDRGVLPARGLPVDPGARSAGSRGRDHAVPGPAGAQRRTARSSPPPGSSVAAASTGSSNAGGSAAAAAARGSGPPSRATGSTPGSRTGARAANPARRHRRAARRAGPADRGAPGPRSPAPGSGAGISGRAVRS